MHGSSSTSLMLSPIRTQSSGAGHFPPKTSTPLPRLINFDDDDATDGYALKMNSGKGVVKEIPPGTGDTSDGTVVGEFVVVDGGLQDVQSRDAAFGEFESEDMIESWMDSSNDGDNEVKSLPKQRKNIKQENKSSMTQAEKIQHAETRLAAAVNGAYSQTNLPHRMTAADMSVSVDPKTSALIATANCLLCGQSFKVAWSGYVYKVQNYKRHLTTMHIDTTDPGGVVAKRVVKKSRAVPGSRPISSFFTTNNATSTATLGNTSQQDQRRSGVVDLARTENLSESSVDVTETIDLCGITETETSAPELVDLADLDGGGGTGGTQIANDMGDERVGK